MQYQNCTAWAFPNSTGTFSATRGVVPTAGASNFTTIPFPASSCTSTPAPVAVQAGAVFNSFSRRQAGSVMAAVAWSQVWASPKNEKAPSSIGTFPHARSPPIVTGPFTTTCSGIPD